MKQLTKEQTVYVLIVEDLEESDGYNIVAVFSKKPTEKVIKEKLNRFNLSDSSIRFLISDHYVIQDDVEFILSRKLLVE